MVSRNTIILSKEANPMWQLVARCRQCLFPSLCVACDAPAAGGVFCAACHESLEPPPADAKARSAYTYSGALAVAIRKAKFHPDETRARALRPLFVDAYADEVDTFIRADVIAYVPSHWRRRIKRGFELPALLASALARRTDVPLVTCLRARDYAPPLAAGKASVRERRDRVCNRFVCAGKLRQSARVVLVDDVVSTGSTLQACREALVQAGAEHVICLTLAASS